MNLPLAEGLVYSPMMMRITLGLVAKAREKRMARFYQTEHIRSVVYRRRQSEKVTQAYTGFRRDLGEIRNGFAKMHREYHRETLFRQ